jgi:hypothetical protein
LGLAGKAGISEGDSRRTIGCANPAPQSTASTDMSIPAKRVQLGAESRVEGWRFMRCADLERPLSPILLQSIAASVAFNTSTRAFQQYNQRSNEIKRQAMRRSKRPTTATLVAAVATVTMITETIKTAMIVMVRDWPSGVGRLHHPANQPRSITQRSHKSHTAPAQTQLEQSSSMAPTITSICEHELRSNTSAEYQE